MTSLMVLTGMIGGQEFIIVLIVVLLLFGGKKIPELMRGLGKGMKEFKKAANSFEEEIDEVKKEVKKIDPTKELKKQ